MVRFCRKLASPLLKQQWRSWLVGTCLGISFLGGGVVAGTVWLAEAFSQAEQVSDHTPEQLESWLGVELPDSINQLHSQSESWQDSQVFVRLHGPASSVPDFVERNGLVVKELESAQLLSSPFSQAEDLDWWNLEFDLAQAEQRWIDYQDPAEKWTAYGIPPIIDEQFAGADGATEQGFYFPTIAVIPTEKANPYELKSPPVTKALAVST